MIDTKDVEYILDELSNDRLITKDYTVDQEDFDILCFLRRYGVFITHPSTVIAVLDENETYYECFEIMVRMSRHCDVDYLLDNIDVIAEVMKL